MTDYDKIIEIKNKYPQLTFNNNGYEYLSKEIEESNKEIIKELSDILRKNIEGFVEFNNFKPRKDGSFAVRVQYKWDEKFTGVGYFKIEDFKNNINGKDS